MMGPLTGLSIAGITGDLPAGRLDRPATAWFSDRMLIRIALIHAVAVAMPPVEDAFRRLWPDAERFNVLDDALSVDRARAGALTGPISARIGSLAAYGLAAGADGVLFTCSAFGPAIEAAARAAPCPVLNPNEAMFAVALECGTRIGMLATFEPSVASMEEEFAAMARLAGVTATLRTHCVPAAMRALQEGDGDTHDRLLAEAAPRLGPCDAILLAQFSTARARAAVAAATRQPVLTSPDSAVLRLRSALERTAGGAGAT